jgi:hypothetical protein
MLRTVCAVTVPKALRRQPSPHTPDVGSAGLASLVALSEWTELCGRARVSPDAQWSVRFLHRRLWRTGKYTEEATIERIIRERRKAHVCAEVTLHGPRPCASGRDH